MPRAEADRLMQRLEWLAHPAFLLALALLIVNDWLLKPLLHNALTGKLSDFAGLFAFAFFCSAMIGRRFVLIHAIVGLSFVYWKSPFSTAVIQAWNDLGIWPLARVVDASDLFALVVLPLSLKLLEDSRRKHTGACSSPARWSHVAIAAIALAAFTATSRERFELSARGEYFTRHSPQEIETIIQSNQVGYLQLLSDSLMGVGVPRKGCDDDAIAEFKVFPSKDGSLLSLQRFTSDCEFREEDQATLFRNLQMQLRNSIEGRLAEPHAFKTGDAAWSTPISDAHPR